MSDTATELTVEAVMENMDEVLAFVDAELKSYGCPKRITLPIDVAVEELFTNIASYSYLPDTGPATVRVEVEQNPLTIIITFVDQGVPYDPLAKKDPDMTLEVEERRIGGLGIFMVKNSMDDVQYEYRDGRNILTISKKLWEESEEDDEEI